MPRAAELARHLRSHISRRHVRDVRGAGLLLGLDVGPHAKALREYLITNHILVGGSDDANVLRLMPPLTTSRQSVDQLLAAIEGFRTQGPGA